MTIQTSRETPSIPIIFGREDSKGQLSMLTKPKKAKGNPLYYVLLSATKSSLIKVENPLRFIYIIIVVLVVHWDLINIIILCLYVKQINKLKHLF